MCQLKAVVITKEQCITGFKATLCLCQVAASKRVPTWLVAGNGGARQRPTMYSHLHTALASTCVRLIVATTYVQMTRLFKQIYILVSFEAIHCVKLISCK